MAIRLNDLKLDTKAMFKDDFLLADITPLFPFNNGERAKTQTGYTYTVVLPNLKLEKISVKIENLEPLVNLDTDEVPVMSAVKFENLQVTPYLNNNNFGLSCKADSIRFVDNNTNVKPTTPTTK